jgi:Cys-tRNA(Pro)/Cys-tRNA(Cys) deacylase
VAKKKTAGRTGAGTPATVALTRAGVTFTEHTYDHDADGTRSLRRSRSDRLEGFGLEAAEALGVEPATVFKTLLAVVDGDLVVGIVPVTGQLDLKALAAAVGGKKATMADPAVAERVTGYVVGGISPLGQKRRLRTVLDTSADDHEVVYVSGGRRGLDLGLAPADLARLTGATRAAISRS